jgi:hypothetical protein
MRRQGPGLQAAGGNVDGRVAVRTKRRARSRRLSLSRDGGDEAVSQQYGYDLAGRTSSVSPMPPAWPTRSTMNIAPITSSCGSSSIPTGSACQFSSTRRCAWSASARRPGDRDAALYDALGRLTEQRNGNGRGERRCIDPARGWLTQLRTTGPQSIIQDPRTSATTSGTFSLAKRGVPEEPTWCTQHTAQDSPFSELDCRRYPDVQL